MKNQKFKKGGLSAAFFNVHFFLLLTFFVGYVNESLAQKSDLKFVFYNVENLFDTIDNPLTFDEDFTPQGKLVYDSKRFTTKLENIASVLNSISPNEAPAIIGLCEVENRFVLEELVQLLEVGTWDILHFESPDGRGIDNAIIYNLDKVIFASSAVYTVDLGSGERPTRDILFGEFTTIGNHKPIGVFVNHWPSRYGGVEATAWKRMKASNALSNAIEAELLNTPSLNIICMGDFNDHPDDPSLMALINCDTGSCLVNLFEQFIDSIPGTYVYRGEWGVLDQILVNQAIFLGENGAHAKQVDAAIFISDFMLYESAKSGEKFPSRSYSGVKYFGGYSDHLPIILTLHLD
jgi:predicted extracellular nuclease